MLTLLSYQQDDPRYNISISLMRQYLSVFLTHPNIEQMLNQYLSEKLDIVRNYPQSIERFRFFFHKDPILLRQNYLMVSVHYRTTEDDPNNLIHEDSPWRDAWVGEFYLRINQRDGGVIEELLLYEPTLLENVGQTNYALQNYTEFPETWELAEQRMRLDDLYMPGTNVPREEATKEIYESLRADLPRKQLF